MDSSYQHPSSPLSYRTSDYYPSLGSPASPLLSPSTAPRSLTLARTSFPPHPSYFSPTASFTDDESPVERTYDNMGELDYDYASGAIYGIDIYDTVPVTWAPDRKAQQSLDASNVDRLNTAFQYSNGSVGYSSPPLGHVKQEQSYSAPGEYEYLGYSDDQAVHHYHLGHAESPESLVSDSPAYYTPPTLPVDIPRPQFVAAPQPTSPLAQLSTMSPTFESRVAGYSQTRDDTQGGCDPRFVSGSPPSFEMSTRSASGAPFAGAFTSGSPGGESEIDGVLAEMDESDEEIKSDDDDSDYVYGKEQERGRARSYVVPSHNTRSASSNTRLSRVPRATRVVAPIPVPNLTKKSRGRRVPTASPVVLQNGVQKNARTYTCKVKDCGKCFARGEHLKRHIRSIHTNEKPHKCPQPGCGKEFSRHDNLCQHMRVHKNFSAPREGCGESL